MVILVIFNFHFRGKHFLELGTLQQTASLQFFLILCANHAVLWLYKLVSSNIHIIISFSPLYLLLLQVQHYYIL